MIEKISSILTNGMIGKILSIFFILIFTVVIGILVNRGLKKSYKKADLKRKKNKKLGKSSLHINKTRFNILRRFLVTIIYIIGILISLSLIPEFRNISYSIFAGAGVIAIIIGFATQEIFSNMIAGIFISLFQPFRIDDRISIGEELGFVEDITLWHTVIRTFNNQRLMIPNSIIAKEKLINYSISDETTMNFIDFSISYDSDIDLAKKIISEEVQKSEYFLNNAVEHKYLKKDEPFYVRVVSHGEFSIGLMLYVWTKDATDGFLLRCEILEVVKKRFDKEGVEIPFPYRTIVEKKNLPKNKKLK